MKRSHIITLAVTGVIACAGAVSLTLTHSLPSALAAPPPKLTAVTVNPFGDLLSGKPYPLTLPTEQMDPSYHLVALVDAQGKANLYATRGDTTSAGGETYLVAYEVILTDLKTNPIPQPKPGTSGQIIFIDLHAIQAMGGVIPIKPATVPIIAPAAP